MELITADEIADRLKLSKRQVAERICYEPDFPAAYRFGRKLRRWNRDEVEAWIRSRKHQVAGDRGLLLRLHRRARRQCEQQQHDETHGDDDSPESLITHFCPALASNSVFIALPRVEPK